MWCDLKIVEASQRVKLAGALVFVSVVAWTLLWGYLLLRLSFLWPVSNTFWYSIWILGCFATVLPLRRLVVLAGRTPTIRVLLKHRLCASCGYSLANLSADVDGCTVCPECGSAWRIPAAKDV